MEPLLQVSFTAERHHACLFSTTRIKLLQEMEWYRRTWDTLQSLAVHQSKSSATCWQMVSTSASKCLTVPFFLLACVDISSKAYIIPDSGPDPVSSLNLISRSMRWECRSMPSMPPCLSFIASTWDTLREEDALQAGSSGSLKCDHQKWIRGGRQATSRCRYNEALLNQETVDGVLDDR